MHEYDLEYHHLKLGLSLSGGGFRASFFHLGVLAQMARQGLLRQVEAISTVSGGSIIGSLFYLHVKRLLEDKIDDEITDRDYIQITEVMEKDFLKAVQCNLRMLTFANFLKNLNMFMPNYSRSDRIGELYDELLYRPVKAIDSSGKIQMRHLMIHPKQADGGKNEHFDPDDGNSSRQAKVPILLINATTLNNGHNWRFEAKRMGEPPMREDWEEEIDKNVRLNRGPTYNEIAKVQQDMELGLAVAASACVPGVFQPLAISDLYPEDFRLQLVDGGVYDNQGVEALLDSGCRHLIISDASGQLGDDPDPQTGFLSVLMRSNSILMDRVREEQLRRLNQGQNCHLALVHLRKELPVKEAYWIGSDGQPAKKSEPVDESQLTSFGVALSIQDRLSKVRTDLDSFTEVEACSLMMDGYLMSKKVLSEQDGIKDRLTPAPADGTWGFLKIQPWMENPTDDYLRQLKVASQNTFKIFRLNLPLGTVAVTLLITFLWKMLSSSVAECQLMSITVSKLLWAIILIAAGFAYPWLKKKIKELGYLQSPAKVRLTIIIRGVLALLSWGLVKIHLQVFDPWFLRRGRIDRLQPPR